MHIRSQMKRDSPVQSAHNLVFNVQVLDACAGQRFHLLCVCHVQHFHIDQSQQLTVVSLVILL